MYPEIMEIGCKVEAFLFSYLKTTCRISVFPFVDVLAFMSPWVQALGLNEEKKMGQVVAFIH